MKTPTADASDLYHSLPEDRRAKAHWVLGAYTWAELVAVGLPMYSEVLLGLPVRWSTNPREFTLTDADDPVQRAEAMGMERVGSAPQGSWGLRSDPPVFKERQK